MQAPLFTNPQPEPDHQDCNTLDMEFKDIPVDSLERGYPEKG